MNIVETLVTPQVLALAAAIVAVLFGIGKAAPVLRKKKWWLKLLPILPLVLGVGGAFLPGVITHDAGSWGSLVLAGLFAGFLASHGRNIFKRLLIDKMKSEEGK